MSILRQPHHVPTPFRGSVAVWPQRISMLPHAESVSAACREVSGVDPDAAAGMSDSAVHGAPSGSNARSDSSEASGSTGDESDDEFDEGNDEDGDLNEGALLEEDLEDVDDETLDQYRYWATLGTTVHDDKENTDIQNTKLP